MPRLAVLLVIAVLLTTLVPPAHAGENGVFDESFLFGEYFATDLFALRNGEGVQAWGVRAFNGVNVVASLVNFASRTPMAYAVDPTGPITFTQGNFNAGASGTLALNGDVVLWSPSFGPNADTQAPGGYGALRIGILPAPGAANADFEGDYSQHALVFDGLRWWNLFGGADANGAGSLLNFRNNALAATQSYSVQSTGAVEFGGTNGGLAALAAGGDLLVQSGEIRPNVDSSLPGGYEGLMLYLRRAPPDKGLDATSFRGRYRIHELRVRPLGNVEVRIGEVEAGGAGLFFGTLGGAAYDGALAIFPSGVFSMSNDPDAIGTLGANGDIAVVTREDGQVNGGSGTAWMQIWVRTAGGAGNSLDSDGDGLSDAEESAFNTNRNNADTDGDGIIDGLDARPRTPDNRFTATLSETALTVVEGTSPDPLTLTLDADGYPFFSWAVTADENWADVDPAAGIGDATLTVTLDTDALAARETPYETTLTINAPAMAPLTAPQISVTVQSAPLPLELDPAALVFEAMQDAGNPAEQSLVLSAANGTTQFDWVAESSVPWLEVAPSSGTGPGTIAVRVDIDGLQTADSPFNTTIRFREARPGAVETELPVSLVLSPPRTLGLPFAPVPAPTAQGRPAVGYDPDTDRYALAWEESGTVRAMVMDGDGVPRLDSFRVPLIPLGPAQRPTVAVDTARSVAWLIWEQENVGGGSAFLSARTINLDTLQISNVFGLVTELDQLLAPHALYNAEADEIVAGATVETGDASGARLFRIDPVTRNPLGASDIAPKSADTPRRFARLAWDPVNNTYLAAWEEDSGAGSNPETSTHLQRIDAATAVPLGDALQLDTNGVNAAFPRMTYVPGADAWTVVWTRAATPGPGGTIRIQRFHAADLAAVAPAESRPADAIQTGSATAVYSPEAEQLLWAYPDFTTGSTQSLAGERRSRSDFSFPGVTTLTPNPADQIESVYSPGRNEFLLLWRARAAIPVQLRALRLAAGDADEDGDTLPNDWEFQFDLDPFDATGENGAEGNPDNDRLGNAVEFQLGTDPRRADTDGDGLEDWQEDRNGDALITDDETNPVLGDTDMDGANDGVEWFLATSGTDPDEVPETALFRIDYGNWFEGLATRVSAHVFVRETGNYTLAINDTGAGGLHPPAGWSAAFANGPATRTLTPGAHVFTLDITPPDKVTPATDHGLFTFTFSTGDGGKTVMNTVFVVDNRTTFGGKGVDDAELAARYAPVLRLHRNEAILPIDLDFALETAAFDRGYTRPLGVDPVFSFDLFQSPQSEAALDFPGETIAALRDALPPVEEQPAPKIFYTATTLGGVSAASAPPASHVILQYYLYFPADAWGFNRLGGHRHEGDWEVFQLRLNAALQPLEATATQQWQLARDGGARGGATANWTLLEKTQGTHPVLYAGGGSHSLYFRAGKTSYATGPDYHDGLGNWFVPATAEAELVATDYIPAAPYELVALPRLTEPAVLPWQRYAGRWGQRDYPTQNEDAPTAGTRDGPQGPAFLGTSANPADTTAVASVWTDPWAWAVRMPRTPAESMTTITGAFDASQPGRRVVLLDAKGRIFRTPVSGAAPTFRAVVPRQHYTLSLTEQDAFGRDVHVATARYRTFAGTTLLVPAAVAGTIALGTYSVVDGRLEGDEIYATNDTDGDGTTDINDADQDADGFQNNVDDDDLDDGFSDLFQQQDADGDGIPRYFDADDDNDGTPDGEDDDADGNTVPDADQPADSDGDGVVDAADLDIDNDGFTNATEETDGTDPYNFFDNAARPLGDLDADGDLDAADLQQLVNRALGRQAFHPRGDFNRDGSNGAVDIEAAVQRILGALAG